MASTARLWLTHPLLVFVECAVMRVCLLTGLLLGCVSTEASAQRGLHGACLFNDECRSPLICAAGRCRAQCRSDRDCSGAWRCLSAGELHRFVCYAPDDHFNACVWDSQCRGGNVCGGDRVCRRQCVDDYDCEVIAPGLRCLPPGVCSSHPFLDGGALSDVDLNLLSDVDASPADDGARDAGGADDRSGTDDVVSVGCAVRALAGACTPGVDAGCELVDVSLGQALNCARFNDGSLRCWSPRTASASYVGNGGREGCPSPGLVRGLTRVSATANGYGFSCVVREGVSAPVWCWGSGGYGFPGVTPSELLEPTATTLPRGSLVLGEQHGFSLTAPGVYTAWGSDGFGQHGDGTRSSSVRPPHELRLAGLVELAAGFAASCGRFTDGEVRCWGSNMNGQLGAAIPADRMSYSATPLSLPGLTNAVSLRMNRAGACARRDDQSVWCWGQEPNVGDGMTRRFTTPRRVFDRALEFAMHDFATCVLRDDRTVWCTGEETYLGIGRTTPGRYLGTPTRVRDLTDVLRLYGGGETMCAQVGPTELRCWGIGAGSAAPSGFSSVPLPMRW